MAAVHPFTEILTTQLQLNPIQSNFNPGWGYKVTGLNTTHPTHPQTFNPVPGNLEQ